MAKKYEGKDVCCTCAYKCIRKDENCDPCDSCYSRNEQHVEGSINCWECIEEDCKYRQ